MSRDTLKNALRRVHTNTLHNTSIEVYEPAEEFEQGDGWTVTYPTEPASTLDARVESPSADAERERSGTTAELDVVVKVRSDVDQTWTGFGEETEAPVRVEDSSTGIRYEVENVVRKHNGLVELEAVEV